MSRWTKGELTIGEIAQMERAIIDCRAAGTGALEQLQQHPATLGTHHLGAALGHLGTPC